MASPNTGKAGVIKASEDAGSMDKLVSSRQNILMTYHSN